MPASLFRKIYRGWLRGESFWDTVGMNENLKYIDDHLPLTVTLIDPTSLPSVAQKGDTAIYKDTGVYRVYNNDASGGSAGWTEYPAQKGLSALSDGVFYENTGSAWVERVILELSEAGDTTSDDKAISPANVSAIVNNLAGALSTSGEENGAALIGFLQEGVGAVGRTAQDKMRERISLKDFGAKGDGVTDDTAAVLKARNFIIATGKNVLVTVGTYLCDPFTINSQVYALQGSFVGTDRERSVLKRRTSGTDPFITVGSTTGTAFQAGFHFTNLKIDGGAASNGDAFVAYDMVRSVCDNCSFTGGNVACHLFGGIALSFKTCLFEKANTGFRAESFTSSAGGGFPNLIKILDSQVVDNTNCGVYFAAGRMLTLDGCNIEGNGTTKSVSLGGVYVAETIGFEVQVNDQVSLGLLVDNCWFEGNKGVADVNMLSGQNSISNSNFFSTGAMVENDIRIAGGKYALYNLNISFPKTENILELSGVLEGNTITRVEASGITWNQSKTTVSYGTYIDFNGGRVPVVIANQKPIIQTGSDTTGVNPTITFAVPYASGSVPIVYCQAITNSTSTIESPEVYSVSNTGFTVRKKTFNGSSIGTSNYTVHWFALGGGANPAPVANQAPTSTLPTSLAASQVGSTITSINLTGTYFSDPDGDTLTYTASGLPAGITMTTAGFVSGTPTTATTYTTSFTANDGNGGSITRSTSWPVNPAPAVNNPPTSTLPTSLVASEVGSPITPITLTGTYFSDPDGDTLTYTSSGRPPGITISSSGYVSGTPTTAGTYSTTITANDGNGGSVSRTTSWPVNPAPVANQAPTSTLPSSLAASWLGSVISFNLTGTYFSDPDGDTLTYTTTGLPPGINITSSGAVSGSPTTIGTYTTTITANDGNGGSVTRTTSWPVIIDPTNSAPTSTLPSSLPASTRNVAISPVNLTGSFFSDPDGDTLTYTSSGRPPGITISSSGYVSGTPTTAGTYSTTITASDGRGGSVTRTTSWPVNP